MQGTSLQLRDLLFGTIGIGFFTCGRKQRAVIPLVTGIALFFLPYFFTNVYLMVSACAVLVALPYFIRF